MDRYQTIEAKFLKPGFRIEVPQGLLTVVERPGLYTGLGADNSQEKTLAVLGKTAFGKRVYVHLQSWDYPVLVRRN